MLLGVLSRASQVAWRRLSSVIPSLTSASLSMRPNPDAGGEPQKTKIKSNKHVPGSQSRLNFGFHAAQAAETGADVEPQCLAGACWGLLGLAGACWGLLGLAGACSAICVIFFQKTP